MFLHQYVVAQLVCLLSFVEMNTAANMKPLDKLLKKYRYPLETHTIHTSDHYILTYHRVPHGKKRDKRINRPPVLLVHGIFMSSRAFLANNKNLPYMLADAGFDVWLANYRGNFYSRRHETLDPVKDKTLFWNYTLSELGSSDLPAAIDYILTKTGHDKLSYIGESMGTTMFWVLGAMRPEYMSKVSLMVAIAPVARPSHMALLKNFLKRRIALNDLTIIKGMGFYEIMLYNELIRKKMHSMCNRRVYSVIHCKIVARIINIYLKGMDSECLQKALSSTPPSGISINVLIQYVQIATAKRFQEFDYGAYGNIANYGSKIPPMYDLKRVTCPVYLIYSEDDDIANFKDIKWLMKQLPNKPTRLLEYLDFYSHVGFDIHKHVHSLLNRPLAKFMKKTLIKHKNLRN